jgi:hypothetical protein
MRRGIMLAIFCELCLALFLNSTSVLADTTRDWDDKIEKLSSHDAQGALSGYAPWKDIIRSLKDFDFDGVLAIHWTSGDTTFSNGFKHASGKRHKGASGDDENILLLSEIITCVPLHNGCKKQALFAPVKLSSDPPSAVAGEGFSDPPANDPVSANATLATPESGSIFLLALGILGLSPMLFRRKRA